MVVTRIDKHQLEIGMYVEAIEGSWQDNPTLGRRFLVKDGQQLAIIRDSNVSAVFINTALGRGTLCSAPGDVASPAPSKHDIRQQRLQFGAKIHCQASETRLLIQSVFEGRDLNIADFSPLADDIGRTMEENAALFIGMSRLRSRDMTTFVHSLAVGALLLHFGRSMEMDETTVRHLCIGGLLHDLGKLSIPRQILNKQGPLSAEERTIIEQHPDHGYRLLQGQPAVPDVVLDICRSHHERLDGKGYPDRLSASAISTEVRMATICDVFDALTAARPYKKGWSSQQALSWMMAREDRFDKTLLWRFVLSLDTELTKGII